LSAPFLWEEHEQPFDYSRYTSYGLREIITRNGYEIERLVKTTGTIEAVF
jgi:hypothetical protein